MANRKQDNRATQAHRKVAQSNDNGAKVASAQPTSKRYDVAMIRAFLGQLLVELRNQNWEQLTQLRKLEETGSLDEADRAFDVPQEKLIGQLEPFFDEYKTVLVVTNITDFDGVPDEERTGIAKRILSSRVEQTDARIGHLEALSDLFDEALHCAKIALAPNEGKKLLIPRRLTKATDYLESADEGVEFIDGVEDIDEA